MGITKNEMPGKKRKYNSRFPPARIKKIMQTDKEVGKVAAAVPVLICKSPGAVSEISLDEKLSDYTIKTQQDYDPSTSCIETEKHFEFLKDLMSRAPPVPSPQEDNGANGVRAAQRKRWQDIGLKVKHRGTAEKPRGQNEGSLDSITHSDQDSEPELLFCLGKDMPKHPSANRTRSFKGQDPSASAVLVWYP